jgi:1-acyl-sn-glycerol-3-phosphate acyltransferase
MWDPLVQQSMPDFWPPKPGRFWSRALGPLRRHYLHRVYKIANLTIEGAEHLATPAPDDGVLIAPNHSHDSEPHVMMAVGRELHRTLFFMAAWQIFKTHWGIDGFVMQRMGAFSVDREGCDRRSLRQATELLTTGKSLVVFPEGEVFHLNARLTPLKEGVAFMALSAQRDLQKEACGRRVWVVPTAIRYRYIDDVRPQLAAALEAMEQRLLLKPRADSPLHQRILRLGEMLLTIKEKETLGHSRESEGDLPSRLRFFIAELLSRLETEFFRHTSDADPVPLRVKVLRRAMIEIWLDEKQPPESRQRARAALDDVQLVLQLYSYPGDYLIEEPSLERMAETIEKFEEDLFSGISFPKGRRDARVRFGPPLDLTRDVEATKLRVATAQLTGKLEERIETLIAELASIPLSPGRYSGGEAG